MTKKKTKKRMRKTKMNKAMTAMTAMRTTRCRKKTSALMERKRKRNSVPVKRHPLQKQELILEALLSYLQPRH